MPKKRRTAAQAIGGIVAGIDGQIFRTTPPAQELVAKGAPIRPVAAAGGGTITIGLPDEPTEPDLPPEPSPQPGSARRG
jgi:hypothetical protein